MQTGRVRSHRPSRGGYGCKRKGTADSITHSMCAKKQSCLWRICELMIFGSVVSIVVLAALRPVSARAAAGGVPAEITALQTQVTSLQTTVSALQSQVNSVRTANAELQNEINSLKTSNATLQSQLAAVQSNPALALGPFVSVDPHPENEVVGPNIIFKGANIHIVSGSNTTVDNNGTGLGNLIIGYNEEPPQGFPPPFFHRNRGGAHNLVIGRFHRFPDFVFGGLVAGEANTILGEAPTVTGGSNNVAAGVTPSVSGGVSNTASGEGASVSGGGSNTANGFASSVGGGNGNIASGMFASASGGEGNNAAGLADSITGGIGNTAGGRDTVVIGGKNVTDNNDHSIAPQPPFP